MADRSSITREASSSAPRTAYCLRGEIEGVDRTFPLGSGEHLVGSSSGSQIRLPVAGVSRRHARVTVGADGVTVTDLASKNGTRVAGRPVGADPTSALAEVGDEIRFGPLKLRLQSMALGLELRSTEASSGSPRSATSALEPETVEPLAARYPHLLATVVELLTLPSTDLRAVAQQLADSLPVAAVAFVEWRSSTPAVLAASTGQWEDLESLDVVHLHEWRDAPGDDARPRPVDIAGWVGAALRGPAAGTIFAVLTHPKNGARVASSFFCAVLRVVARIRAEAIADLVSEPQAQALTDPPELCFPASIVPGRSPAMLEVYQQLRMLLQGQMPVLLLGETGVGKEHLASMLHSSSQRRDGPFVAVNCAALPGDLLEAELFGIGQGVATGVEARDGDFLRADGGTMFLDEVAEIPLGLQAKLLRVLQERQVRPVGRISRAVDVRVVAATNVDLRQRVDRGEFRSDLYFRLAGYELAVPPLRRRREDLAPLIAEFLERFAAEPGKRIRGVSVKALAALCAYRWPGNVRELEHEVRRLVYRCPSGQAIDSSMLSEPVAGFPGRDADLEDLSAADASEGLGLVERVDELQRRLIRRALAASGGNQSQAARRLAVSRSGLLKRIKRLGLETRVP